MYVVNFATLWRAHNFYNGEVVLATVSLLLISHTQSLILARRKYYCKLEGYSAGVVSVKIVYSSKLTLSYFGRCMIVKQ